MDNQQTSALSVFSDLIWEYILDNLDDDSRNIENVFRAFPELGVKLNNRKTVWLFDQVFPHLFKYLASNPGTSNLCREVCKRWCNVADNFTRTHPSLRPYDQDGLTRRSVHYGEFSYFDLDLCEDEKCVRLPTVEKLNKFREEMVNYASGAFNIRRAIFCNKKNEIEKYWDAVILFLETFGKYILDIHVLPIFDFEIPNPQLKEIQKRTILKLLKCLNLVPNVRSIIMNYDSNFGVAADPDLTAALPQLDHLEYLNVDDGSTSTLELSPDGVSFLKRFEMQLRRLLASSSTLMELEFENQSFKNLVELEIMFSQDMFLIDFKNAVDLSRFKHLKKLRLIHNYFGMEQVTGHVSHLFALLTPLHQLEELDLKGCYFIEDGFEFSDDSEDSGDGKVSDEDSGNIETQLEDSKVVEDSSKKQSIEHSTEDSEDPENENGENPSKDALNKPQPLQFPSVKYVKITDCPHQALDLLTAFPSLTHLSLVECFNLNLAPVSFTLEWKRGKTLSNKMRQYIYAPVIPPDTNIWNEIPSLNLLTITDEYGCIIRQFVRECGNQVFQID